ncbi:MAG: site-specific integrase [Muribaculaceae bacterium]|nr:site-specific integrase [Muribaculaceae bacterium]
MYYIIRGTNGGDRCERNITSGIRGAGAEVISEAKDRIAYDLMTIYCVIESSDAAGSTSIDDIVARCKRALAGQNPYAGRIRSYAPGKFPVCSDIAVVAKMFSDRFESLTDCDAYIVCPAGLLGYTDSVAAMYEAAGRPYAKSLRSLRLSLGRFVDGDEIPFSAVDNRFILGYIEFLEKRVSAGTVSFYVRVLRNIVNKAVGESLLKGHFHWPSEPKRKPLEKAASYGVLEAADIARLERLDLSDNTTLSLVRDMFLFGFYARGMELVDIANLRPEDLDGDVLTFRRRKIGTMRSVRLGDNAMAIVARYADCPGEYLFPILERKWVRSYYSVRTEFAAALKDIGSRLGHPCRLSFGMGRHTWLGLLESADISDLMS